MRGPLNKLKPDYTTAREEKKWVRLRKTHCPKVDALVGMVRPLPDKNTKPVLLRVNTIILEKPSVSDKQEQGLSIAKKKFLDRWGPPV